MRILYRQLNPVPFVVASLIFLVYSFHPALTKMEWYADPDAVITKDGVEYFANHVSLSNKTTGVTFIWHGELRHFEGPFSIRFRRERIY